MEGQDQSYSVTPQASGASACPAASAWVWRLAAAFVLGGLVGVYQPQQPALLPDGLISGGALTLAVLGSLALVGSKLFLPTAALLVGLPLALFGGALGAFLRLRLNRLTAQP